MVQNLGSFLGDYGLGFGVQNLGFVLGIVLLGSEPGD